MSRVNVNVEPRSTFTFTRAFHAPSLFFLKKFTCVLKSARKFYVRSHGKNTCQSASLQSGLFWHARTCDQMLTKLKPRWNDVVLFFALRCFSVKFAPFDFFYLVTKLSKVCQIHTFAVSRCRCCRLFGTLFLSISVAFSFK